MASLGSLFVPGPAPPDPAFLMEDWEPAYLEAAGTIFFGLCNLRCVFFLEMHRQVRPLRFGPDGLARRGVLVRHRVMPGKVEEAAFRAARKAGLRRFDRRAGAPCGN